MWFPQRRKGAKKTCRKAAAVCAAAPLREKSSCYTRLLIFFLLSLLVTSVSAQDKPVRQTVQSLLPNVAQPARTPQSFKQEGVAVDFSIEPVGSSSDLMEANEARIEFRITETLGGKPLTNLRPMAWIDSRENPRLPEPKECREKVQDFLQANFAR